MGSIRDTFGILGAFSGVPHGERRKTGLSLQSFCLRQKVFPLYPLRVPPFPRLSAKPGGIFLAVCLLFSLPAAAAQTGLETELRTLEERVRVPGSAERRENLARLARLRELSGDIEGAAAAWELAALAAPGGRDTQALLRGAACFMALGEWERADAALTEILLDSGAGEERFQASFLKAVLAGLQSSGTAVSALVSLLEDSSYGQWRPRIYFSLWKLTGRENWRQRLAAEFPRSPEGRIAASSGRNTAGLAVSADPSPMWLLFAAGPASSSSPPAERQPREPAAPQAPVPGQTLLQAGLFSRESNARNLMERLQAAGFSALTGRRAGGDYTAVYVAPGPDINKTIRDLKAAGFDSFPAAY
jgi:hypothetical protein